MSEAGSGDAKQCPWCQRWCLKDNACAYVFSCGLDFRGQFHSGLGCGRTWCWTCGKKFCGQYTDPVSGQQCVGARNHHDGFCCRSESGFNENDYCPGGHSGHCGKRW